MYQRWKKSGFPDPPETRLTAGVNVKPNSKSPETGTSTQNGASQDELPGREELEYSWDFMDDIPAEDMDLYDYVAESGSSGGDEENTGWSPTYDRDTKLDSGQQYILEGHLDQLPHPASNTVRVFLSSTFSDMKAERNILYKEAHPVLQEHCQQLGLDYQVCDLRWGVTDETVRDHSTSSLCLNEIRKCQRISAGPNFVAFLGDRYGFRPLQVTIPAEEFNILYGFAKELNLEQANLMTSWYKEDKNALPPVYVLQPIDSVLEHYSDMKPENTHLRQCDRDSWDVIMSSLQSITKRAAAMASDYGHISKERKHDFYMSVTESEIRAGIIQSPQAPEHCIAFVRRLEGLGSNLDSHLAPKFIDLLVDEGRVGVDQESVELLHRLSQEEVPQSLEDHNYRKYSVPWTSISLEQSTQEEHTSYLHQFSADFIHNMKLLIGQGVASQEKQTQTGVAALCQETVHHASFCNAKVMTFCGRTDLLNWFREKLTGDADKPLVLHGSSGFGKTSVIAMVNKFGSGWISECCVTVIRFLGTSPSSSTVQTLLKSILQQVCLVYRFTLPDEEDLYSIKTMSRYLVQLMWKVSDDFGKKKPLVILLDSLDQLSPLDGAYTLAWLPTFCPPNVHIVVSTLSKEYGILDKLKSLLVDESCFQELGPLPSSTSREIIKLRLESMQRCLTYSQEQILFELFEKCPQPLYIKMLLDEALKWKSYTEVNLESLPVTAQAAINQYLKKLEDRYGNRFIQDALGYITISKNGLSEVEVEDALSCNDDVLDDVYRYHNPPLDGIIRIPPLLWARLREDIQEYIAEKRADGKTVITWYHRQFNEVSHQRFVAGAVDKSNGNPGQVNSREGKLHSDLAALFLADAGIKKTITLKHRKITIENADRQVSPQPLSTANLRKLNMLPYHLYHRDCHYDPSLSKFKQYVACNFEWMLTKLFATSVNEVVADLKIALAPNRYQDEEVEMVRDFLQLSDAGLRHSPHFLAGEVIGRLYNLQHLPGIRQLVGEAEDWLSRFLGPIVCPVHPYLIPPGGIRKSRVVGPRSLIDISLDDATAVGTSETAGLSLWSLESNELLHEFKCSKKGMKAPYVKMTADGKTVMAIDEPGSRVYLKAWDVDSGQLKHRIKLMEKGHAEFLGVTPDGSTALVATSKENVLVVNLQTLQFGSVRAHEGVVLNLVVGEDGRQMLTSGKRQKDRASQLIVWDLMTMKPVLILDIRNFVKKGLLQISRSGTHAVAVCHDCTVIVLGLRPAQQLFEIQNSFGKTKTTINSLAVSTNGHLAVTGGNHATIHLWDTQHGQYLESFQFTDALGYQDVTCVALTEAQDFVVASCVTGMVYVWSVSAHCTVKAIGAHTAGINNMMLRKNDSILYTASVDRYIKTWLIGEVFKEGAMKSKLSADSKFERDQASSDIPAIYPSEELQFISIAVTADNCFVLAGAVGRLPTLWDLCTGRLVHQFTDPEFQTNSLEPQVYLACGDTRVVAHFVGRKGGTGNKLWVWDTATRQLINTVAMDIAASALMSNGHCLVIGCRVGDGYYLVIWDLKANKKLKEISLDESPKIQKSVKKCGTQSLKLIRLTPDDQLAILLFPKSKHVDFVVVDLQSDKVHVPDGEKQDDCMYQVGQTLGKDSVHFKHKIILTLRNHQVLIGTQQGQLLVWDAETFRVSAILEQGDVDTVPSWKVAVKAMSQSTDGSVMAVGRSDGSTLVFDMNTHKVWRRFSSNYNQVWALAISQDKQLLACGYRNNFLQVWDLQASSLVCELCVHVDVHELMFSVDKKHIIALLDQNVFHQLLMLRLQLSQHCLLEGQKHKPNP